MEPLQLLSTHLLEMTGKVWSKNECQKIVNICAEIIVIQDQQEFEDKTREAIEAGGGCSRCGDLSGFECYCDDDAECNLCELDINLEHEPGCPNKHSY